MSRSSRAIAVSALLLCACSSPGSQPAESATPAPPAVRYSPPNLPIAASVRVPEPFAAYVYSEGLKRPTATAIGPDNRLYVAELLGHIVVIPAPGSAPEVVVLSGLTEPLGIAWRGNELFVADRGKIVRYQLEAGRLGGATVVAQGLPVGRHQNDNILFLPNGDILVGVGSTCDDCREKDERSATVLRFRRDWSYAGIVMKGVRNPYGIALRRSNGQAYITVNGQDDLGPDEPADHLMRVVQGADGGWPRCWPSFKQKNLQGSCSGVTRPVALFEPHTSADGFAFYETTTFPREYWDNAFVAEWGADATGTTIGRRVVRVVMSGSGDREQGTVTDFATGFDRPLAVAVGPDGGLLVADFGKGTIIEIAPAR